VRVGDLVVCGEQEDAPVGVVTEVRPQLHVASILDACDGETGLRLALPGTVYDPVEVIGSIPLSDIVMGFMRRLKEPSAFDYDRGLREFQEAYNAGPVEYPRLQLGGFEHSGHEKPTTSPATAIIELTKPGDAPELAREVALFIFKELGKIPNPSEEDLAIVLGQMEQRTTVATFGGDQLLATGQIQPLFPTREGFIGNVVVSSASRGTGLGRVLVESLEDVARNANLITVSTIPLDEVAAGFWEHLGYQEDGYAHTKSL